MNKRRGGFETFTFDDYEITNEGDIINLRWGGKKVKPQPNGKGYLRVQIAGKRYFVHRLVAEKYVPNPDNKPQVNHKDGNKLNNCANNLEWVTNQENRNHAVENQLQISGEKCPYAKLTSVDVNYIRQHEEISNSELAKMFNVSQGAIADVKSFRTWKNN